MDRILLCLLLPLQALYMVYLHSSLIRYVEIFRRFLFLLELLELNPFQVFILLELLQFLRLVLVVIPLHPYLGASISHSLLERLVNQLALFYPFGSMNIQLHLGLDILLYQGSRMCMQNSIGFLV